MKYLEIEAKFISAWRSLSPVYKRSFWIAFGFINLAFLFHTINFMFGDHDWHYIRHANYWSEGAFEGRPLHFVLQSLLFGGHVVPILNNFLSFAALSLSGVFLAKYWRIPLSTLNYTLFAIFTATLPYTMVWLFYAKDMLINISLPLICISGLILAQNGSEKKNWWYHVAAVILFYFAFASYAAVINLLGVCFIGGLIMAYKEPKEKFLPLLRKNMMQVADMFVALILYMITLKLSTLSTEYNTQTVSLDYLPQKLVDAFKVMFEQFIVPLPFMEEKYKFLLLVLFITGIIFLFWRAPKRKAGLVLLLLGVLLFSSKLAYLIAEERGQILAEMENFAFVPRLDFYGLVYVYAFGLACILSLSEGKLRKVCLGLAIIITFMSFVRDMYAQKVWKFGFDAEMKAHERIVSRMEQTEGFNPERKYRLLQLGNLSMRQNYYRKAENEQVSLDLLETSFTPEFMSRLVYNFYYPWDLFNGNAKIDDLSPRGKSYLLEEATPYPAPESIYIDGDIIIIVLTDKGLAKAVSALQH